MGISREVPWTVMPDLYFYRDPEEAEKEEQEKAKEAAAAAAPPPPQAEEWNQTDQYQPVVEDWAEPNVGTLPPAAAAAVASGGGDSGRADGGGRMGRSDDSRLGRRSSQGRSLCRMGRRSRRILGLKSSVRLVRIPDCPNSGSIDRDGSTLTTLDIAISDYTTTNSKNKSL